MIHLDFIVDPVHVVYHLLLNRDDGRFIRGVPAEQAVAFQQEVAQQDPEAWDFLGNRGSETFVLRHPQGWAELAGRAEESMRRSYVLVHALELGRAGNGDDPGLLGQEPGKGDLCRCGPFCFPRASGPSPSFGGASMPR